MHDHRNAAEPDRDATVPHIDVPDPAWVIGGGRDESRAGAAEPAGARPGEEPAEPVVQRPRRRGRVVAKVVVALVAAGVLGRWGVVEAEMFRARAALAREDGALHDASAAAAERDRRIAELEGQLRQAATERDAVRTELATASASVSQATSETTQLRDAVAAKDAELATTARDLEEARRRALQAALDQARAQACEQRLAELQRGGHKGHTN